MWSVIGDLDRFRGGLQRTPEAVGRHSCESLGTLAKLGAHRLGGGESCEVLERCGRKTLGTWRVAGGLGWSSVLSDGALDKILVPRGIGVCLSVDLGSLHKALPH